MVPEWRHRLSILAVALGCIVVIGYADYRTDFDLDLFLFYALPVAITAWGVGRAGAVGMSALAMGTWFCANLLWRNPYSSAFYLAWNTMLRCGWILIVALAVARIRADLTRAQTLNVQLEDTLGQVKQLRGLLPICAWCKRIRNDSGYWEQLEAYLAKHAEVSFTHGICPACEPRQLGLDPSTHDTRHSDRDRDA